MVDRLFFHTHPYWEQHTFKGHLVPGSAAYSGIPCKPSAWTSLVVHILPHSATASQVETQTSSPQKSGPKPQYPFLEQHPVSHFLVLEHDPNSAVAKPTNSPTRQLSSNHLAMDRNFMSIVPQVQQRPTRDTKPEKSDSFTVVLGSTYAFEHIQHLVNISPVSSIVSHPLPSYWLHPGCVGQDFSLDP